MAKLIKAYKNNYTIVDNDIFKDKRLSYKDLGLLCQLLSLPDNWNFNILGLVSLHTDGKASVMAGLENLEKYGYLTRKQARGEGGYYAGYDYYIYQDPKQNKDYSPLEEIPPTDEDQRYAENRNTDNRNTDKPSTDYPSTENPMTANPITDNQTQLSNVSNKLNNNKNVVVYKNKEQLSKAINTNDIYKNNLLETMDIESFDYKKQMDYECYKSFPDIKIDIIKMMKSYSVQCFRYILSCHPNSMDKVKKTQELVFKALLSNQLEGKEKIIDDFSGEEYAQILSIAFSIETSDDIKVYTSPIAYLVGVIENLISQHVMSKGGDVNDE